MPSSDFEAVFIPDARLSSAVGSTMDEVLARLADPRPFDETPEGRVAEETFEAARERALALGIPEGELTRTLLLVLAGALPLLESALSHGFAADEIGFIVGGTAAGTPEVVGRLRNRPDACAQEKWSLVELSRSAPWVARAAGIAGPVITVSTACTAGAKAIAEGARLIACGRVKAVVAGGVDVLSPLTEGGFSALGARSAERAKPFRADRTGLHLGEGGGFLLMTADTDKFPEVAPEDRIYLAGAGETSDAHHICAPEPEGRGAAAAIKEALGVRKPADIGFALLHGTATAQNDAMEARAMATALPGVRAASVKRAVGHQLAGAGAFNAALAWGLLTHRAAAPFCLFEGESDRLDPDFPEAFRGAVSTVENRGPVSPGRIVASAFAFGGSNAALLLERGEHA
ncbi:beta-ketoacyl synthase N-terminal-like domain-containing protein [Sutterella sp.]|uniref:beta-ketoacyl synthase N-terminal-like domain-containing protein n=1 Tax=Sutterella sp. TaxID=1981025 RepID=UPI0026DF29C3|nr:beta-ketoacyl synthase N-terminal-like domain-containing protein [Sutterella sp.]MDO5530939.1 beta-ketoacyl synthase N-terminal-like domain-containing protein [Sutterella sp.]